jgi:hypothetical protein
MTQIRKSLQPSSISAAEQEVAPRRRPSLGARLLGWTLLTLSVGLVSCQSMFVL